MSLNGVSNTVFPNTLNGLDSLNVTNITIDGQTLASLFVPYTGALSNVDLNNKSLTGINGLTTGSATATGLVQGQNVTATALTTTNTLKINSVPAGTTAKYLATNATGDVIEADITTKYVPYTGATSHVNLNAKNLSNVLTYSGTNVQVTSTETTSLLATGTTQVNTLRITDVQIGSQVKLLAVDSIGTVIGGTIPVPTTVDVTVISSSGTYYPIWVNGTTGGIRALQSDNVLQTISYDTGTKTLTTYQLKLLNVPAGTQTSVLAIDSAGNVIQGTVPAPTQLLTTEITLAGTPYYPALVQDRATGVKSIFNENSLNTGNMYFLSPGSTGGLGTWRIPQLVINNAITLINARFATTPSIIPIASVSYALGLNASNDVISYVPSNQTAVTAVNNFADYNLLFTATSTTDPNIILNIDNGTNLKYNPATDTLTVPNLTVGTAATINAANLTGVPVAPTAAPGTNTTQVATTAFVIANAGTGFAPLNSPAFTGIPTAPTAAPFTNTTQIATTAYVLSTLGSAPFLPLSGGIMIGTIVFDNTVATAMTLNSANLTAYTYSIRDSFWNLPMLEFTTKTASTFGSVNFGVPIAINNITSTNLISLPFSSTTPYPKSISNSGGDIFMTFTNRTTAPVANGSVVFGSNIPVAINSNLSVAGTILFNIAPSASAPIMTLTNGKFTSYTYEIIHDGTDGIGTFMSFRTPASLASPAITPLITLSQPTVFTSATATTFNAGIRALAASLIFGVDSGWGFSYTIGGVAYKVQDALDYGIRLGSMFDFSVAGDWDNSNSLYITTGGLGGTNSGVGMGFNTALNSGLLVSIAPNVAWKRMSYKAEDHYFYTSGNTFMGGFNSGGVFANNAGYMTNSVGAANAGLTGFGTGDLIFFANAATQVMRFYTGTSCRIAMGANQIYADTIVPFTNPSAVSVGGVLLWRDTTRLNLSVGTAVPTTGLGGNTNIIFGYECGRNITSGVQNVLMGVVGTGDNITTGNQNTLIGYQAGRIISTGSLNTAIGQQALAGGGAATCSGNYNCAIGHFTLTTLTTGSFNSALGVGAGTGLTTGNFCTYIGTNAQPSAAGVNNEVVISSTGSAVGKGGNTFFTQAGASYNGANSNVWNTISDRNIKKDIVPLTNELHKIMALRPVHFEYKETGIHGCGFIAQEWKEIFPELHTTCAPNVYQREVLGLSEVEGILTDIVPHIVKAMQEQQAQIEQQNRTIQTLVDHMARLTEAVNKLTIGQK